jgi:hypothetical protein
LSEITLIILKSLVDEVKKGSQKRNTRRRQERGKENTPLNPLLKYFS